MGFLSNLRHKNEINNATNQNDRIFAEYLRQDVSQDDLQSVIDLMDHPEIRKPVMKNIDGFLRQPNLSDDMRNQLQENLESGIGTNKLKEEALDKLRNFDNKENNPSQTIKDELNVKKRVPTFAEKIHNRIRQTYQSIQERIQPGIDRANKVIDNTNDLLNDATDITVNAGQNLARNMQVSWNMARDRIDTLKEKVQNRMNNFKEEFGVRKMTLDNDSKMRQTLKTKGLSTDAIKEGIQNMDYPEVRYPMINNAKEILNQHNMTPDIAREFYESTVPYLNDIPDSELKDNFYNAFQNYNFRSTDKNKHEFMNQVARDQLDLDSDKPRKPLSSNNEQENNIVIVQAMKQRHDGSLEPENIIARQTGQHEYTPLADIELKTLSTQDVANMDKISSDGIYLKDKPSDQEAFNKSVEDTKYFHMTGVDDNGESIWSVKSNNGVKSVKESQLKDEFDTQYACHFTREPDELLAENGKQDAVFSNLDYDDLNVTQDNHVGLHDTSEISSGNTQPIDLSEGLNSLEPQSAGMALGH